MRANPNRRGVLKTTATLAAAAAGSTLGQHVRAAAAALSGTGKLAAIDAALRSTTAAGDLPGIVAMAANDGGVFYEGAFGSRRLGGGPDMTRDTVFSVASMVKPITSVAALRLVEQNKLSLETPVPDIDPAIGSPQVLSGFDPAGGPRLRPAKRPITLHHLLTHTAGFAYRLWDAEALHYFEAVEKLPAVRRKALPRTPLMFDPGERWQYGTNIDWVGRLVEAASGEPLDVHFRRNIFEPLGMKDTAFVVSKEQRTRIASVHRRRPDGSLLPDPVERENTREPAPRSFSGGGGIHSTAGDYLTFIRALLNGGSLGGARLLRPDTVALMGRNQIGAIDAGVMKTTAPALSNDVDFFPGISLKWGFGHMINMQPVPDGRRAGSLTWAGLCNTYYWIDPTTRVAAVFMTQVLPFADRRALRAYRAFERGIYAAVKAG